MKTITGTYVATFIYHGEVEVDVTDDASPEEMQKALEERAESDFDQTAQFANGLTAEIKVTVEDDEDEDEDEGVFTANDALFIKTQRIANTLSDDELMAIWHAAKENPAQFDPNLPGYNKAKSILKNGMDKDTFEYLRDITNERFQG